MNFSKDMNPDEKIIILGKKEEKSSSLELKKILINAIRTQAIYSKGKITILETSDMIN
jgi:hypothetical protein